MDRFSLFESLYRRSARGRSWSEGVITWAMDQLEQGADTASLRILAGLSLDSREAEVREYFDATLAELGVDGPSDVERMLGEVRVLAAAILRGEVRPVEGVAMIHHRAVGPLNHPAVLQPWCDLDGGFRTIAGTSKIERLKGDELERAILDFAGDFLAADPAVQLERLEAEGGLPPSAGRSVTP